MTKIRTPRSHKKRGRKTGDDAEIMLPCDVSSSCCSSSSAETAPFYKERYENKAA
jgi:hypothetical protein